MRRFLSKKLYMLAKMQLSVFHQKAYSRQVEKCMDYVCKKQLLLFERSVMLLENVQSFFC